MAHLPLNTLTDLLNDALADSLPGRTVWVALSGGLDSTLLTVLAAQVCRTANYRLKVLHVNHGLQAQASAFETHCQTLCDGLNVPLVIERVRVLVNGDGVEAAARQARYTAYQRHVASGDMLWMAHHQEDQAETLLLAALRGSGVRGLAGIPYRRDWQGIVLVRPWLSISRQVLVEVARELSVSWCEDPTNQDIALDRNRLRRHVLPALRARWPEAARSLAQSARHASEADQLLADYAADTLTALRTGPNAIDVIELRHQSLPRQRLLVRTFCQRLGLATPPLKRLESLLTQLSAARDKQVCVTWPGGEARMWRNNLYVMAPIAPLPAWQAEWDGSPGLPTPFGELALQLDTLHTVTLRWRQGGEVIHLPKRGRRDLKRLLQESAFPPWERERLIVVMDQGQCLGVLRPPEQVLWQAASVHFKTVE